MKGKRSRLEAAPDAFLRFSLDRTKEGEAEYVRKEGVDVPRIFRNFAAAMEFAKIGAGEIVVRSQHKQDYDGASGLLRSYTISRANILEAVRAFEGKDLSINWDRYTPSWPTPGKDETWHSAFQKLLVRIWNGRLSEEEFQNSLIRMDEKKIARFCRIS